MTPLIAGNWKMHMTISQAVALVLKVKDLIRGVGNVEIAIAHSERRQYVNETDETVNKKALTSLKEGLKPILCVGESLEQREDGKTIQIVRKQVIEGLNNISPGQMKDVVIAYEPVWAIGTGRTAKPEQAEEVHDSIRELLYETFNLDSVKETRIIYGGSVKSNNIDSLMAQPNIDGALVGGASLSAEEFSRIVKFEKIQASGNRQ